MHRVAMLVALLVTGGLLASRSHSQTAWDPNDPDQAGLVTYREHFTGETRMRDGETVRVDLRTWTVRGGLTLDRLPMEIDGLMIVHLRGGELETIIQGERVERREDTFWTVPRGATMTLATEDDTAVFDTIVIREP